MEPGLLLFLLFVGGLYLLAGMCCVEGWKDMFNDIPIRPLRALTRMLMVIFWPLWLAFWAVCVIIAITVMGVIHLCE